MLRFAQALGCSASRGAHASACHLSDNRRQWSGWPGGPGSLWVSCGVWAGASRGPGDRLPGPHPCARGAANSNQMYPSRYIASPVRAWGCRLFTGEKSRNASRGSHRSAGRGERRSGGMTNGPHHAGVGRSRATSARAQGVIPEVGQSSPLSVFRPCRRGGRSWTPPCRSPRASRARWPPALRR